jgi:hypothetical protein
MLEKTRSLILEPKLWTEPKETCRLHKFQFIGRRVSSPIGHTFPRTGFRECLANGRTQGDDPCRLFFFFFARILSGRHVALGSVHSVYSKSLIHNAEKLNVSGGLDR